VAVEGEKVVEVEEEEEEGGGSFATFFVVDLTSKCHVNGRFAREHLETQDIDS
jgi:hypothetical protein